MTVTTHIECGNGRILSATPELIEIELIAYSKGSRYTYFRITDIDAPGQPTVVLRPDSLFRSSTFPYKRFAEVWVRIDGGGWEAVQEVEKTPEFIRFPLNLRPGRTYDISTEPPRSYTDTTRELIGLAQAHSGIATLHCPGASIEGRPIMLLRVTSPHHTAAPGKETAPVIHIACGEHATEFSGEEMGRGMLDLVCSPEGADLRERFIFDFILNCNPDGNYHGWHQYNHRDWLAHNYTDTVDRSWHHELASCLAGEPGSYSSETDALIGWLRATRPAFYISLHSWEGHQGNPGSFYTDTHLLTPPLAAAMNALNDVARAAAREGGYLFDAVPTSYAGSSPHLGHFLMEQEIALAYLPEGNYAIGREALQELGRKLLHRWLNHPSVDLSPLGADQWERLANRSTPQAVEQEALPV